MRNLATTMSMPDNVVEIIVWGAILILAVIVLFGGVWYYRRWWLRKSDEPASGVWTLDDLKRMKETGQIDDAEYQALRGAMIAAFGGKKADSSAPRASTDPGTPDNETSDFDLTKGSSG